jgi:hypothetical protein
MKTTKKLLAISLLSVCSFYHTANAQLYKSALGVRLGYANGVTFKTFFKPKAAFEGIATFRYRGYGLTGLYEVHGRAFNSRDFNWLIGGGGHVYGWNDTYRKKYVDNGQNFVIGLDGILGLEAKVRKVPLAISLDWKPVINLVNSRDFGTDEVAFSFRYTW